MLCHSDQTHQFCTYKNVSARFNTKQNKKRENFVVIFWPGYVFMSVCFKSLDRLVCIEMSENKVADRQFVRALFCSKFVHSLPNGNGNNGSRLTLLLGTHIYHNTR